MPANTPATSSTDTDPDTSPSLSSHHDADGSDGADGAALSREAVAEAAAGLAPRSEGHAVEEGMYDASAIQVLEGLEAGSKRPGMYISPKGDWGPHHPASEGAVNRVQGALA